MAVILDTFIWIDVLSGRLSKEAVQAATAGADVYASLISLGELRFGAEIADDPMTRAERLARLRECAGRI